MVFTGRSWKKALFIILVLYSLLICYYLVPKSPLGYAVLQTIRAMQPRQDEPSGRILITGGMGNLGKYITADLLFLGYKVICLDVQDLTVELDELLQFRGLGSSDQNTNFLFVKGDIRDERLVLSLMSENSYQLAGIIHLAAVSRVAFCLDNEVDCRDVNTRGTQVLLDCMRSLSLDKHQKKPWVIFASSREIYGSDCDIENPCDETFPPNPVNLYGQTKWQGEEEIREKAHNLFSGYIILRLASVYGGLYDLPERLVPSLAMNSMKNDVIDLNGGEQLFDFVHIDDVVASFVKAVENLSISSQEYGGNKFLICSGRSASALQVMQYIRDFSHSTALIRRAPFDTRYPSNFVCDNKKMKEVLLHDPDYSDVKEGIADYMSALYRKTAIILGQNFERYCSPDSHKLNVSALDGCSIFVMSLEEGPTFLSHLTLPNPTRYRQLGGGVILRKVASKAPPNNTHFTFEYEEKSSEDQFLSLNGTPIIWEAVFHPDSGGYLLQGDIKTNSARVVLGKDFQVVEGAKNEAMALSIWPYSCSPDPITRKARLPTKKFDPSLYLLHQIIPPEENLPKDPDQPLYCRRIMAAIDYANQCSRKRCKKSDSNNTTILPGERKPERSQGNAEEKMLTEIYGTLCDTDCDLPAKCVQTGQCRCVEPFCTPDLRKESPFPFHGFAYTKEASFPYREIDFEGSKEAAQLPYSALLQGPVIPFSQKWEPPRVHVMSLNVTKLIGEPLDESATTFNEGDCFVADHFLRLGFQQLETSLTDADFLFVPFYEGWFKHYKGQDAASLLEHALKRARSILVRKRKDIPIILPASHDFGANLDFTHDMRDWAGTSISQHPMLKDVIVLSPFGDFNTLGYIPRKDIVIPPATCNTPFLLQAYKSTDYVRKASNRTYLAYFSGSIDKRTGSSVRAAYLSGNLFPNTKSMMKEAIDQSDYIQALNESIFCPHIFGTTGWATRLADSIYAGCIPVLTSDITHPPFHDVLDWSKFSVFADWREPQDIEQILSEYSKAAMDRKQAWLLKVRDAFIFDTEKVADEISGKRKGPLFYSLLSMHLKRLEARREG